MTTQVARTPWPVAVRAHFGLLWWSRRAGMMLAITLGLYLMLEGMLVLLNSTPGTVELSFLPMTDLIGVMVMIAAGWGIAVWRGETNEQRLHLLTAPIDVSHHELARVAAGAVWLITAMVGFVIVGLVVAAAKGEMAVIAGTATGIRAHRPGVHGNPACNGIRAADNHAVLHDHSGSYHSGL
jgi:hypothetical protein